MEKLLHPPLASKPLYNLRRNGFREGVEKSGNGPCFNFGLVLRQQLRKPA